MGNVMYGFSEHDLDGMGEQDVREDILAPLIRDLGYRKGSPHYVERERTLVYKRESLGRRKKSDPVLTGRADYLLAVDNKYAWTLEAKSPQEDPAAKDIEQSYSYAKHPEIAAVYYAVANGRRLIVRATDVLPNAPPVLDIALADTEDALAAIKSVLSPGAILKMPWHPSRSVGKPLGPGVPETSRVIGGEFRYTFTEPRSPYHAELVHRVRDGIICRIPSGGLFCEIGLANAVYAHAQLAASLRMDRLTFRSAADTLSINDVAPTRFEGDEQYEVPAHTAIPGAFGLQGQTLAVPARISTHNLAIGRLSGRRFAGTFESSGSFELGAQVFPVRMSGLFAVELA